MLTILMPFLSSFSKRITVALFYFAQLNKFVAVKLCSVDIQHSVSR